MNPQSRENLKYYVRDVVRADRAGEPTNLGLAYDIKQALDYIERLEERVQKNAEG